MNRTAGPSQSSHGLSGRYPIRKASVLRAVAFPGHLVRLPVEKNLQAVLHPAQKPVVLVENDAFLRAQAPDSLELRDRHERGGMPDLLILAAVQQLEKLHHEFDVADAAVPGLDFHFGRPRRDRPLLDPPLERLDFGDLGGAQKAPIDKRLNLVAERLP